MLAAEICLHFRHQLFAQKRRGILVDLPYERVLLRIAPLLPGLIDSVSQKPPVKNEVDVFREALDEIETLRQARPSLECERVLECGFTEEVIERPADPEILLDDSRVHPLLSRRDNQRIRAVFLRQRREFTHAVPSFSAYP